MFDGSSIAGWKAINESDMILMPDADDRRAWTRSAARADADHLLRHHRARRPARPTTATRARIAKKRRGLPEVAPASATRVFVGPEAEFFVFDDVQVRHRRQRRHLPARQRSKARRPT
jgi:glutamine synthetase